ncbi:MAG TPA: hypothetical protein VKJ65_00940, partial [Phycisphaerae bacterium]|nr:hypothetical protein [Phycisphaerae bacterium]
MNHLRALSNPRRVRCAPGQNGAIRYGEMLAFKEYPRCHENFVDAPAVVCLTPTPVLDRTGVGLFWRCYTNSDGFIPRH